MHVDVIIADIVMPSVEDHDFMRTIVPRDGDHIPTVVLSGDRMLTREWALRQGFSGHLRTPVAYHALFAAVTSVLLPA
jgi:CheY-like chemotaxis protein